MKYLLIIFLLYSIQNFTQNKIPVSVLIIGSDGNEKFNSEGVEKKLQNTSKIFSSIFSNELKMVKFIPLNQKDEKLIKSELFEFGKNVQKKMLVVVIFSGNYIMNVNEYAKSKIASKTNHPITMEYLFNLPHILSSDHFLFITIEQKVTVPPNIYEKISNVNNIKGGRYILRVSYNDDLDDIVDDVNEVMEDIIDSKTDLDGDGYISYSEWIKAFIELCQKDKKNVECYLINNSSDILLRKVKR